MKRLIALSATITVCCVAHSVACVMPLGHPGDQIVINQLFLHGGARATVALCPATVFRLTAPIVLTAEYQLLETEIKRSPSNHAILRVEGADQSTAIQACCAKCSNDHIRNLDVDGSRPALGRIAEGDALITMGGPTRDQVIEGVRAYEPRGWSTLHVVEGSGACSGAIVRNNHFGPAGQPPGKWADGISFACRDGSIDGNVVEDATDGGIVVFGSPGSHISRNLVVARHRTLMGGINMVDFGPYDGSYRETVVSDNRIEADGAFIKVGLAIGPGVWGESKNVISGGIVTNNVIDGNYFGYGIGIAGVRNFDVGGNVIRASFKGYEHLASPTRSPYPHCDPARQNAPPSPVVVDTNATGNSTIGQFVNFRSPIRTLICIQP